MVGCDDVQGSVTVFPPANMGGEGLAQWAGVPFLGRIPMFTSLEKAAESGVGVISQEGEVSSILARIVNSTMRVNTLTTRYRVSCKSLDVVFCLLFTNRLPFVLQRTVLFPYGIHFNILGEGGGERCRRD